VAAMAEAVQEAEASAVVAVDAVAGAVATEVKQA